MKLWMGYFTYIHSPLCIRTTFEDNKLFKNRISLTQWFSTCVRRWGKVLGLLDLAETLRPHLGYLSHRAWHLGAGLNPCPSCPLEECRALAWSNEAERASEGQTRAYTQSTAPPTRRTTNKDLHYFDSGLHCILNFCWLADLVKAAAVKGFIRHITWQTEASVSAASVTIR